MVLMLKFCWSQLRFYFLPFAFGFHDLNKVDMFDYYIRMLYM
jgi:hypothetical protein